MSKVKIPYSGPLESCLSLCYIQHCFYVSVVVARTRRTGRAKVDRNNCYPNTFSYIPSSFPMSLVNLLPRQA